MANQIRCEPGGISGLREFLAEHKEAVQADLLPHWHLWDIGRRLGWDEFRAIVNWLPPTGDSALWRSRKPQSWWVTPEVRHLAGIQYALELRMWQASGSRSGKPKPPKFPEDHEARIKSGDTLDEKRQSGSAHLKRRRAEEKRKRERR